MLMDASTAGQCQQGTFVNHRLGNLTAGIKTAGQSSHQCSTNVDVLEVEADDQIAPLGKAFGDPIAEQPQQ
jgi:hypothetical protein